MSLKNILTIIIAGAISDDEELLLKKQKEEIIKKKLARLKIKHVKPKKRRS